jgi:hypothetical protein
LRKILLIVLFFAAVNNLHSQDTVNAKFFPMHVGNYYVYKNQDKFFTWYQTVSITRDTTIDNKKYFYFTGFGDYSGFLRFDSLTSNLLKFSPGDGCSAYPNDIIIDSLASSVNNIILDCGFFTFRKCLTRSDSILTFLHDGLIYANVEYTKDIGLTFSCSGEPPPCEGFSYLQGAIINGVLWGDTTVTYLEQISSSIPEKINLHQNYPNPFNPATLIKFEIPKNSNARVSIYDNTGRIVETIVNKSLSPGTYEIQWNAANQPSGVYFYRLQTEGFSQTKRMVLIK